VLAAELDFAFARIRGDTFCVCKKGQSESRLIRMECVEQERVTGECEGRSRRMERPSTAQCISNKRRQEDEMYSFSSGLRHRRDPLRDAETRPGCAAPPMLGNVLADRSPPLVARRVAVRAPARVVALTRSPGSARAFVVGTA